MNVTGRIVAALLTVGVLFTILAVIRGQFDGAATLAAASIFLAVATTARAAINRKRNQP